MPRSGIAGWYRISIFGFLRNFHAGLHDSCTKLPVKSVFVGSSMPISSLAFVFLMVAILTGVRRDLEVVLISIFLMPKDTEHSKNYVCVFCASSENSLFSSFALTVSLTVFRSLVKRAGVTPVLGRWRREGQEFKVSLRYTESLRPTWSTWTPLSKVQQQANIWTLPHCQLAFIVPEGIVQFAGETRYQ